MRDVVVLVLAGGALIFSLLAYQRVEEVSEAVHRLAAEANQEAFQRNRVLTLGRQLEELLRSLTGTRRTPPPTAQ